MEAQLKTEMRDESNFKGAGEETKKKQNTILPFIREDSKSTRYNKWLSFAASDKNISHCDEEQSLERVCTCACV